MTENNKPAGAVTDEMVLRCLEAGFKAMVKGPEAEVRAILEAAFAARPAAEPSARAALQAIADLPSGRTVEVMEGHEDAYRAVEKLFAVPPNIEAHTAAEPVAYAEIVEPYVTAQRMVREAIGELFGPVASIESDDAVLLRGPEPTHEAEAQIAALQRIRSALVSAPQVQSVVEARTEINDPQAILQRLSECDAIVYSQDGDSGWFVNGDRAFVGDAIITLREKGWIERRIRADDDTDNYRGMAGYDTISPAGRTALASLTSKGEVK